MTRPTHTKRFGLPDRALNVGAEYPWHAAAVTDGDVEVSSALIGTLIHAAIAQFVEDGHWGVGPDSEWTIPGRNGAARRRADDQISTSVAAYIKRFLPHSSWTPCGTLKRVAGVEVDIIWGRGSDRFIDELKTGAAVIAGRPAETDQVARLIRAGVTAWGADFRGVRVVTIGATHRAYCVDRDFRLVDCSRDPRGCWCRP